MPEYTIQCAGISHRGRVRQENEDTVFLDSAIVKEDVLHEEKLELHHGNAELLAIADGIGGQRFGAIASRLTLETLGNEVAKFGEKLDLLQAIKRANSELYIAMDKNPEYRGMGSTVAGAIITGRECRFFNVGDSRIYLGRNNTVEQLSVDDVPSQTDGHRRTDHTITQSIGGLGRHAEVSPHVGEMRLNKEDSLLICSDGLTDMVSHEEIISNYQKYRDPSLLCRNLFDAAMGAGGNDNVSILIAQVRD